ncbi:NAD(P)H-dependent oxidoreductase [Microlunatus sp. Gsoil 973]|uniref:NAD(P)H-dependent oxidoreductase n=1 Tax=Microlunatus sp. Gsoil 973 TaxID=2672569 RepID=UPI0012B4BAF0|nr:NAD(P)H-dependent oxidoreductase [Microlunatus sp. Gsoil 973]QGN35016.1 flavodoxin family protein [Microlunatus sp. Gsoil 973]
MVSSRRALWVLAHPQQRSLNGRLRDVGVSALQRHGWQVDQSDLYATGWDPLLTTEGGPEVAAEQDKLLAADLLVVQFPLWWYGPPAILKGWFDRVFQAGFGYDVVDPQSGRVRKYGDGLLAGKRALIVVSAGDRPGSLGTRGISGHIEDVLWPMLHGTFWYTGMLPLRPQLITRARDLDRASVAQQEQLLVTRLSGVLTEEPIHYLPLDDEHYDHGIRLRDQFAPSELSICAHRS